MAAIRITGLQGIVRVFKQFEFSLPKTQRVFLETIGRSAVQLLRQNTPVATGTLANSWRVVEQSANKISIGTDQILTLEVVTEGTPPHEQIAKPGSALVFEKGGQQIFATRIFHPGTPRNDFVSRVARAMNELVIATLDISLFNHNRSLLRARKSGTIRSTGQFRQSSNITRTVGLSGFSAARRSAGRATLTRRSGAKTLKRVLRLRRRRGGSINSIKVRAKLKGL